VVLKSFVLVGTIVSHDNVFSTVEFNLNPAVNGGPSMAVVPLSAIPCDVNVGKTIYVVKDKSMDYPVITCKIDTH
tara:strand:- start:1139 stop:1363 length:225 start_codon:yes stop_codon:yes gene_type:complete